MRSKQHYISHRMVRISVRDCGELVWVIRVDEWVAPVGHFWFSSLLAAKLHALVSDRKVLAEKTQIIFHSDDCSLHETNCPLSFSHFTTHSLDHSINGLRFSRWIQYDKEYTYLSHARHVQIIDSVAKGIH